MLQYVLEERDLASSDAMRSAALGYDSFYHHDDTTRGTRRNTSSKIQYIIHCEALRFFSRAFGCVLGVQCCFVKRDP